MISTVITLLTHDLAVAFKNKTLFLIVCIPLFVYATLTLVDPTKAGTARMNIALLQSESYAPIVLENIQWAHDQFAVRWVSTAEEATRLLKERKVDGILMHDGGDVPRMLLTVVRQASVETLTIMQRLSALQTAAEGKGPSWIASVRPLQTSSIKRQTLPTWILMMVLLVSFIVLPAQVAEEKEKQLLLGWLQTPVRESEWLVSKLVYGIVLMLTSVVVLQLMGGEPSCAHGVIYLAMLCAGGFCFGALGICLGLLCRNQASARTLGILCYLPLLLPAALSDMSQELRSIAPLVPSYHFYEPIRAMLLEDSGLGSFTHAWSSLVAIGLLACLVSHRLIKKRWLM
ncbi:MAG: ABC transporter permease [Kiritimatiellaeota bacterium]|nr:ABC transporter permease [Kiritimatiellota bacterium]